MLYRNHESQGLPVVQRRPQGPLAKWSYRTPEVRVWTTEVYVVPFPEGPQQCVLPFWSSSHAESQEVGNSFYPLSVEYVIFT